MSFQSVRAAGVRRNLAAATGQMLLASLSSCGSAR